MPTARTTDGVDVAFVDLGGAGPHLVLAHATGFHAHVWRPLAQHLADAFHCFAFDTRGHGDTPPPPDGSFDWHGLARDVLAVVDAVAAGGEGRLFGVGHSAGGTALLLAEQARPGTFHALYCYEPVVPAGDDGPARAGGERLAAGSRRRREVFASRAEAQSVYASKPPLAWLHPEALAAYVEQGFEDLEDGTVRLKCRGEHEARTYEMGRSHGAWDRLPDIACPVTLACGELTDAFGPDVISAQAARLPRAGTEVLPGLGHLGPLQDPAAVAASVRRAFPAR